MKVEYRGSDKKLKSPLLPECLHENQSSTTPQSLEMNKIGEGVLEACLRLLSPPDSITGKTVFHLMDQESNQSLVLLWTDHIPDRDDQVNLKCLSTGDNDRSTSTTIPDIATYLSPQHFLRLRVGCVHLLFDSDKKITYPVSVTRFKWEKQPNNLHWQVSCDN